MIASDLTPDPARLAYLEYLQPKPEVPAYWPLANVIRRGSADEFPRVPEDASLVIGRVQDCHIGLRPSDPFQVWAVEEVALTTVRLDRCARIERRLRDRAVIRVELDWDDERAELARVAGAGLAGDPQGVAAKLRGTPQGCDWMIDRWARLALAVQDGGSWTSAQVAQAHDLLGTPPDERQEAPGFRVTHDGKRAQAHWPEPAELARQEIASLRRRRAKSAHQDAIARAMAEADLVIEPTPELRQLGRHEARLRSWLRWLVKQVRTDAPDRDTPHDSFPVLPDARPGAEPEAADQAGPGLEKATKAEAADEEVASEPLEEQGPLPRIVAGTRKDPRTALEQVLREAKLRKRDHCRA